MQGNASVQACSIISQAKGKSTGKGGKGQQVAAGVQDGICQIVFVAVIAK